MKVIFIFLFFSSLGFALTPNPNLLKQTNLHSQIKNQADNVLTSYLRFLSSLTNSDEWSNTFYSEIQALLGKAYRLESNCINTKINANCLSSQEEIKKSVELLRSQIYKNLSIASDENKNATLLRNPVYLLDFFDLEMKTFSLDQKIYQCLLFNHSENISKCWENIYFDTIELKEFIKRLLSSAVSPEHTLFIVNFWDEMNTHFFKISESPQGIEYFIKSVDKINESVSSLVYSCERLKQKLTPSSYQYCFQILSQWNGILKISLI